MPKCECWAMVSVLDPRHGMWAEVDPEARMPLRNPVGHVNEGGRFYEGDLDRLTEEQKAAMFSLLAERFGGTPGDVREHFESLGYFPIREPVSLVICGLHMRCMM